MKNKILPFSLIIIFMIIFFIFYRGLQETNIYTPKSEINKNIPLFSSELFNSEKKVSSSEIFNFNKFYLLNIWSSWCVPCRQEHSLLMNLSQKNNTKIIGLNYKDTKINAQNFLNELGNPYEKIIYDKDGIYAIEWGAFGIPETFLIYNQKVIKKYVGPLNKESVEEIKSLTK